MIKEFVQDREHVVEHVKEACECAKASQDSLNAIITFVDPEEQLASLPEEGLLRGLPIAIKDNVNTKGIHTTAGSRILSNYVPIYDAEVTRRLKEAGAVTIAKSSMDELAMGGTNMTCFTGMAHNPWNHARMTGGSSGGSAALVAAGVVPMAIGTDTGDSIRKPAAYCGVVGVKPTYGRISRFGVIPYASSLDHVGYFTGNVEDACVTLKVLAGRDERDMTSSTRPVEDYSALLNSDVTGKKIAIFGNVMKDIQNKETKSIFQSVVEKLQKRGAIVEEYNFEDTLMKAILPAYYIIANCEATSNDSNLDGLRFGVREDGTDMTEIMTNSRTQGFGSMIRRRFIIGSYGLFEQNQDRIFRKAQKVRRKIVEAMEECLKEYDAIIAPASGEIAPLLEGAADQDLLKDDHAVSENYMAMANFSGYPSITLPMGFEQGCPVGINVTCRAFEEVEMFDIAKAIEEITGLKDLRAEVK